MNNDILSPKYEMTLIKDVEVAIWAEYKTYKDVNYYISKWHISENDWNNNWENFSIILKDNSEINLSQTLQKVGGDILVKMAIDLGIETPNFIPSIANFRDSIKADYKTASLTFEKAYKQIETHPDIAVGLANSALESIIKEIFKDTRILTKPKVGKTLYDLTGELLKEIQLFPNSNMPLEIKTIGSSLLAINQSIEKLRSEKTDFHGKEEGDYLISDSLYTAFIINSITTVGLFLISFYNKKLPKPAIESSDDLPF